VTPIETHQVRFKINQKTAINSSKNKLPFDISSMLRPRHNTDLGLQSRISTIESLIEDEEDEEDESITPSSTNSNKASMLEAHFNPFDQYTNTNQLENTDSATYVRFN
jgi:hypothetical protein